MRCSARCVLMLICLCCLPPLHAVAGDAVPAGDSLEKKPADASEKKEEAGDAVLYEGGSEVERTVWTYQDAARYPVQKKTSRAAAVEVIRYDEQGRVLVVECYEEKKLISKTENIYTSGGKLMEQTVTVGKNTDKSVWDFAGDKAVSQTKYRNGNKIAFIELHTEPHIIHLYFDGKEVFVGEEQ